MFFADIHIHTLAGVDDGPSDEEGMFAMIDEAYGSGCQSDLLPPALVSGLVWQQFIKGAGGV